MLIGIKALDGICGPAYFRAPDALCLSVPKRLPSGHSRAACPAFEANTYGPANADLIAFGDWPAGFRISVLTGLGYGSRVDIEPVLTRIG